MAETRQSITAFPWRIEWDWEDGRRVGARILPTEPYTGPVLATVGHRAADAYVMAAAPELLALAYQYRNDMRHGVSEDSARRRIDAINAVIAKAEGD